MKKSNYELMRDQMEAEFLRYNQKRMIEKYGLRCDDDYLYLTFIGQAYRVGRNTGRVEWSEDDFQTAIHAGYNDSMTIFDVLCYAKDDCRLSGKFVPVNQLKGAINFVTLGDTLFRDTAKRFEHRTRQLSEICEQLGGQKESVGDVAYRLPLFDFLPVILQFWDSDEEFEPVLKVMWDENLLDYIHYETSYLALGHLWNRMAELLGELE